MKQSQLILSQTPPFSVPLRFFMTAPLFGIAAAFLMLFLNDSDFVSRWSIGVLAYTHLLVLGFLAMVMLGALLQVVSVLTGGQPRWVLLFGSIIHLLLTVGTVLLTSGFLVGSPYIMYAAMLLLSCAFVLFLGSVISGLHRSSSRRDASLGIGLALFSLGITAGLGVWLALGHSVQEISLSRHLTDIHLAWGLLGWGGILLLTVAYAVVPMFQLTPPYSQKLISYLTPILAVGLVIWTGGNVWGLALFSFAGGMVVAMGLLMFVVMTLWIQSKRKKKPGAEVTLWFWRSAMLSLLGAILLWIATEAGFHPVNPLLLGVLMIHGFLISAVNGMLYKILPFLTWLHLSIKVTEHKLSRRLVPNIRKIIPDNRAYCQLWLHMLMLMLMIAATWLPKWFMMPGALLLALSNFLLWLNLMGVIKIYNKTWAQIEEKVLLNRAGA